MRKIEPKKNQFAVGVKVIPPNLPKHVGKLKKPIIPDVRKIK